MRPGVTTPSLVYVTFNNKIQVRRGKLSIKQNSDDILYEIQLYHNIDLERGISLSSLVHWPGMLEEAGALLGELGVDTTDMKQLQEVYRYCLYGVTDQ